MTRKLRIDEALQEIQKVWNGNPLTYPKKTIKALEKAQKQQKLLELYKQAYDKSNAEVLKMFTDEQDEKTTLTNIIGHLDDRETVVQIRELENE